MAAAKRERKKYLLPVGRASWVSVFSKAKPMEGDQQDPQYEITYLVSKSYLKKNPAEMKRWNNFKAGMEEACVTTFKKSIKDTKVRIPNFHNPVRQGIEKEHLDGYGEDIMFIRCKTKRRPGVVTSEVDPETGKFTVVDDPEMIYSGCYIRVSVTPFAYGEPPKPNQRGGKGISVALNSVMFVRDGERLDGGSDPDEDFGEVSADSGSSGDEDEDLT